MNSISLRWMVAVLACTGVHDASLAGCVVVSAQEAVVRLGDAPIKVEGKRPMRFSVCDQMKVESGQVSVCYVPRGSQRTCVELKSGAVWSMSAEDESRGGDQFGSTLLAIAKGDATTKFGQTRDLGQVPGMPYGKVLVDKNLVIPLSTDQRNGVEGLSVEALGNPGAESLTAVISEGAATLPRPLLPGERYRWRIHNAKGGSTGQFRTALADDALRLAPRIEAVRAASLSTEASALLISEVLIEEGYPYNAYIELVRAGLKEPEK